MRTKETQTTESNQERETLDLWPTVGRKLGLSRNAVFSAAKLGQIPTIRLGRRILVPKAKFQALLAGELQPNPRA